MNKLSLAILLLSIIPFNIKTFYDKNKNPQSTHLCKKTTKPNTITAIINYLETFRQKEKRQRNMLDKSLKDKQN